MLGSAWTCSCGAGNTGDVFSGRCWKCGSTWADPPRIQTAASLDLCPDCRSTDGFHKIDCPTHPLPREEKAL